MEKTYQHDQYEKMIYRQWEETGAFKPEVNPEGVPYSIIMPPPNANDPLHVGHAMFVSVEDILTRYHRMKGEAALWLPGTDHAGIETQYVFEKKLNKEGKSRFSYDRETLFQKIWDYVQENSGVAMDQMKQLGASADWSRYTFTLDEQVVDYVLETFEKLDKDGLIYRDLRLVNYCTKCGTSYSELEVKYEEKNDAMFYIKYRLVGNPDPKILKRVQDDNKWLVKDNSGNLYIVVATVRPEPIMIDTHLAVHPDDENRNWLIGLKVLNPITSEEMGIIGDVHADPELGTGVVKLTPGHDPNDFEVAKRHDLAIVQVVDFNGKLNDLGGAYAGLNVAEARKRVADDLDKKGLLEKVDDKYTHNVGVCYRCGRTLEPLPMAQWFVKTTPLAQQALAALDKGETKIHGAGREKILRHWLENLKDWNISRQIVWGIRMPVWYQVSNQKSELSSQNKEIIVGFLNKNKKFVKGKVGELLMEYSFEEIEQGLQTLQAPTGANYVLSRAKPDGNFLQETDTFDTWFSSGQWPVVTLKTGRENDFEKFYPTNVMETAYDILLFWVMRMMLLGIYLTGKSPFKDVYLHGLVRDERGEKMSKSKGNVINPIELVDKYGADALRMALVMSTTPGQDSAVGESKVRGMRNLGNKIWNAGRFIKLLKETGDKRLETREQQSSNNSEGIATSQNASDSGLSQNGDFAPGNNEVNNEVQYFEKLDSVLEDVTRQLDDLKIGLAAETAYNEFWHWFCDECIEMSKEGRLPYSALEEGYKTFLKLLHPFVPFVTEAVWQEMGFDGMLITNSWPTSRNERNSRDRN